MRIIISSLHFSPAFIGHMKAWYKLCCIKRYSPLIYIDEAYKEYFEDEYNITTKENDVINYNPEYVIVQNIGFENIKAFTLYKRLNCKIIYMLHEPYPGLVELAKEGKDFIRLLVASSLNVILCNKADHVIVCSKYAEANCKRYMPKTYNKTTIIPLLFLDNYNAKEEIERRYVSYIGTYTDSHAADVFVEYARQSFLKGKKTLFRITTRSNIESIVSDSICRRMIESGHLLIQQGRPLTESEMGKAFRESIVVWNGYRKSTQSGVLPNSYMYGTPVLASNLPAFREHIIHEHSGMFIDIHNFDSIDYAIEYVINNQEKMSNNCRSFFCNKYYYISQIEIVDKMLLML